MCYVLRRLVTPETPREPDLRGRWIVTLPIVATAIGMAIALWHVDSPTVLRLGGLTLIALLALEASLLALGIDVHRRARARAMRQVEQRRMADEALRLSEARYRSVFDAASEGIMVLEDDGTIIEANEAACLMHGYAPGALDGRSVRDLIAPGQRHRFDGFAAQIEQFGRVSLESVDVRADGETLDVVVQGVRFFHGERPAILAMVNDVSLQRKALQRQARLSRKVMVAQEEERARVSRDLHDGLGQLLTAARLQIDLLGKLTGGADGASHGHLEVASVLEDAADELRRICRGLRPPLLDDLGLEPSIEQLVDEFAEHGDIDVTLDLKLEEDRAEIEPEIALCVFRVLQEALTNVRRHSRARKVVITLKREYERLVLTVYDNGVGFDLPGNQNLDQPGFGLAGMRERARLVNGELDVRSEPEQGTRVVLRVPLPVLQGEGTS